MRYSIRNTYPKLNQVSVFNKETNECLLTGALSVAQSFIFFHSFTRGLHHRSSEYELANTEAHASWLIQKNVFCLEAQIGSVIER